MIAAGLCLMGGCFAQDSSAQAVDTYWPAHSLHMQPGDVYMVRLTGVTLPFWEENMRAGSIAENVSWTSATPGYFSGFGIWEGYSTDALYFGPGLSGSQNLGYSAGAQALGIWTVDNADRVYNVIESASPVAKMQLDIKGKEFTVSTENASQTKAIPEYPVKRTNAWYMELRATDFECDMVLHWWRNDVVQQRFFMAQPLKTPAGNSAFFIHGYDILKEI